MQLLLLVLAASSTHGNFYALYNPEPSTDNYYISHPLLELPAYDITVCFWWKFLSGDPYYPTLVSIATPTEHNYLAILGGANRIEVLLRAQEIYVYRTRDESWEFHCMMIIFRSSTYHIEYYVKNLISANWIVSFVSNDYSAGTRESEEGTLVLYNEQDSVGGSFKTSQVSAGWMACLNIYAQTFSPEELLQHSTCRKPGDVFSLQPGVGHMIGSVQVYKDIAYPVEDISGAETYFCIVENMALPDLEQSRHQVRSQFHCLVLCIEKVGCSSVNFETESKICELGLGGAPVTLAGLTEREGWIYASPNLCCLQHLV